MTPPPDTLSDLLRPERLTVAVDVGANPIDGDPPYKPMLQNRLCRIFGFEPQEAALEALQSRKSDLETYLPYVVGDGAKALLRICRSPGMTSLFEPDPNMLAHFANFSEWGRVVEEVVVATRRLDEIAEITALDFLKIDVQGSELAVFRHGRQRLAEAVAIQAEVSFLPLYKGQPVFGEIDLELRSLGFVPHHFPAIKKRLIAPAVSRDPTKAMNQLLEADIVYVRDFTRPERMSAEQLKQLALVAHHCYGSYDLAVNCIHHLATRSAVAADAPARYLGEIAPKA
jgi:FkbM family methyltransferase